MAFNLGGILSSFGSGLFGGGQQQAPGAIKVSGQQNPMGFVTNFLKQPQLTAQKGMGDWLPSSGGGLSSLFGGKQNMLGTGLTALGAFMPVNKKVPQTTPSLDQLRMLSQQGGGPMGQLAQSKLTEQLNQNLQPMTEVEENQIRRNYQMERDRRVKELQARYHNARPGTDYLTDTNYKQDEQAILDNLVVGENEALAQGRRQISGDFNTQRAQQIAAASGLDTSNTQLMSQIASLDLGQLMNQLQLDRDDAYYLKNLATQIGSGMMNQGPSFEDQLGLLKKYFPNMGG